MAKVDLDLNALFAAQNANDNNSRKNFWYKADDGKYHPANGLNENMAELFGFVDTIPSGGVRATDKVIKRRRTVTYSDSSGNVKGQVEIGSPTESIYASGGTIVMPRKGKSGGLLVTVIGSQGEKSQFVDSGVAHDSGQLSGDSP
jgi:hypothetical protein